MRHLQPSAGSLGPGRSAVWAGLVITVALAACTGPQHVLATRGPAAARIAELWWVMLALATAVSVAVAVLLALGIRSARRREAGRAAREVHGPALVVGGGVVIPAIIIFGVLIFSYRVGTDVYPGPERPGELVIEVIGHQFWWEVRYPEHGVVTANEIHIPAGRPVRFEVSAPDVIHSFWVPQLHGKIDMIPGQIHILRVVADEPGSFRGQCAEFCGEAHALMGFWVVAHEPGGFEAWLDALLPAAATDTVGTPVQAGREIFFAAGCGDCHATRGAPLPEVQGETAPDLSNLGARRTLAAATIPNTRALLRSWILYPDVIKPGSLMPPTRLPIEQMETLLDYLETLK